MAGEQPRASELPGFGNLRNYEMLVEAGFTPGRRSRSSPSKAPASSARRRASARSRPGKAADPVVIRGDPVRTPAQIYKITHVFRDGLGYDAARLHEVARGKVGVF